MIIGVTLSVIVAWLCFIESGLACQFYPAGEYIRFVRVPENLTVGDEVLQIEVHPRRNLHLYTVDKNNDDHYFKYNSVNETVISITLTKSLENLVDTETPQNVLKFKLVCEYDDGKDTISSSLLVTVYVEDLNDHSPIFIGTPYQVTVDELTPVGLTIFRRIRAIDKDKPNTPNSDVQYAITSGNDLAKFALGNNHQANLLLRRMLDYDAGDREFLITVTASDRGVPQRHTNATVKITVKDADDLSPKFTKGVYRTKVPEFYPLTGERIHHYLKFEPPIYAYDQDLAINAPIRYDILAGNDRNLFYMDYINGSLFLEREIDLDVERSLPGNTIVLQIEASQTDNPLKTGVARVEIELIDLNDNLPEFQFDSYNISIVENLPNGFSVLQIIANDQDQGDNGEFTFELEDKSGAFSLDARTGWLMVKNHTELDREKRSTLSMRAYAKEKAVNVITNKNGVSSVPIEVTLLDANDNNPSFVPSNIYEFVTTTGGTIGDFVGQVYAVDPDLGVNGLVSYSIQSVAANSSLFKIDQQTGQIFINEQCLKEAQHTLIVEAADRPINLSERRFTLAIVTIIVNRNSRGDEDFPEFVGAPYEFWVGNNVQVGTSVGQIQLTEPTNKKEMMYDLLHSYYEGVPFAVEEKSGTITVIDQLGNYKRSLYNFEAVVTNEKDISIVTNLTIHIANSDDHRRVIMKNTISKLIELHVKENKANTLIGKLNYENITTNLLKFSIANLYDVIDYISISSDGSLYTQKALDREKQDIYRLTIIAEYIKDLVVETAIYQVTVYVDDENDNPPVFEHEIYEGKIPENSKAGTEINLNYPIIASDADAGINGHLTLTISGNGSKMFRLNKSSGRVYYQGGVAPLNREDIPIYNLHVIAKDNGGLLGEAKLIIKIEDQNDNAPMFTKMIIPPNLDIKVLEYDEYKSGIELLQEHTINTSVGVYTLTHFHVTSQGVNRNRMSPLLSIPEDVPVGTTILRIIADDLDLKENAFITYEMSSETYIPNVVQSADPFHISHYFMIHSSNGEVAVARVLPAESEFRLNVTAYDRGGLKDNITITILIKDVNNHSPIFKKSWYNFDIEEASYSWKFLGKVEATDFDFGQNSNMTYRIQNQESEGFPFVISELSGRISVNGELDREVKDKYAFTVIAFDNPEQGNKLSSSVNVEVNVLDVNDNAPIFYGYNDTVPYKFQNYEKYRIHSFAESIEVPIYYLNAMENTPIGTTIGRVFANDSDFSGNGNGLLLFNIFQDRNKENVFTVDSKDGIISVIGKLDFEKQNSYNVTVVASDLGSPSLSSVAIVRVNVIDVPENSETSILTHRYYEVEVEENVPVPLKLLTLNVTEEYQGQRWRFSIVGDKNSKIRQTFKIDPRNGTIFIVESPDREIQSLYELIIRLDKHKVGRDMTVMIYPIDNEKLGELGYNEAKVVVRVTDVNDNTPKFTTTGKPIIAVIPTSANFGHHIVKLEAKDPDLRINGEIRYQILNHADEESQRFAVDPISGQVRTISNFAKDAGRIYGFDVKATDRCGADDGRSAIANIFVYVLDDQKQLIMIVGSKPIDIEKNMENITMTLNNITGYDVRIRKLEPHLSQNQLDDSITDMYLYAVDPSLNVIVDSEKLQRILSSKQQEIKRNLKDYRTLSFSSAISEIEQSRNRRALLSTLEIFIVVIGCLIFFGTLFTTIYVICVRKKRRRMLQKKYVRPQSVKYAIPRSDLGKSLHFSPSFEKDSHYSKPGLDLQQPSTYKLDKHASKRKLPTRGRSQSVEGLKTSITSLHSSGQDSGLGFYCPYDEARSRLSEDSNDSSYEDSLNSETQYKIHGNRVRHQASGITGSIHPRGNWNRSVPDVMMHHSPLFTSIVDR